MNSAWTTLRTKAISFDVSTAKILLFSAQSYADTVRLPAVLNSLTFA